MHTNPSVQRTSIMEMDLLEALRQKDMRKTKTQLVKDLADMRILVSRLRDREMEYRRSNVALEDAQDLLKLILTLSTNFIVLSADEIDDGIDDVLKAIGPRDSDKDGVANAAEIKADTLPGEPKSKPKK